MDYLDTNFEEFKNLLHVYGINLLLDKYRLQVIPYNLQLIN